MVYMIVALDNANGIGKDNKLCWRQSNDLKRFKELTSGKRVLMGRKTFESIGKPLPNRQNIVLTRDQNWKFDGVTVINNIEEVDLTEDITIIGGGEIYSLFEPKADKIYVTVIDTTIEADTWFPTLSYLDWQIESISEHTKDDKNQFNYKFINYDRIK